MTEQLAPGAPAPAGVIPLCVPEMRGNELRYLAECIETNFVSSVGPFVTRFERQLAEYTGTKHAIAAVTGTAALHIALLVAGVRADDEVVLPALTFIAPAFAIRYCNAWPAVVDVDPRSWQLDPDALAAFLEMECATVDGVLRNRATGRRVSAILTVDLLGHPVDADAITALARRYGLAVVEDATESLGAHYRGRSVGALSDIACLSFNGNKVISTGGGGMILTNRDDWAERARYLTTQAKDDALEYIHGAVGYNYRLTNVAAALGCAQMERLPEYLAVKRRIASTYREAFSGMVGVDAMAAAEWADPTWWMYTILVDEATFGMGSRALIGHLTRAGIQSRPLWEPMHRSRALEGSQRRSCPVADRIHARAVSLPSSVGLSEADQRRVIDVVRAAAAGAHS